MLVETSNVLLTARLPISHEILPSPWVRRQRRDEPSQDFRRYASRRTMDLSANWASEPYELLLYLTLGAPPYVRGGIQIQSDPYSQMAGDSGEVPGRQDTS